MIDPAPHPRPIVILGPTAGGKSELAVALALALRAPDGAPGEVINADSMQVYRHMDAGTAKPPRNLRDRVPHHLLDIIEPTERFTVADWLARTEILLAQLAAQQRRVIVVGGTNLYLKALLEGLFEGPASNESLRAELGQLDNDSLHARLAAVDPAAADRIHRNDRKKLIRALEVFTLTGKPISSQQTQWQAVPAYRHDPILIGLDWPVDAINRRINARVREMFAPPPAQPPVESLPAEVRRLEQAGLLGPQARLALGYQQVLDHLAGRCSLDDAFERTKIETRRFAKRQRTWLKRFQGVAWLPAAERSAEEISAAALTEIERAPTGET